MTTDVTRQLKSERGDLLTTITVGALLWALLLVEAVWKVVALFSSPGAVTVTTTIPPQHITAAIGDGASATVETASLVVPDVSAISVVSLVLAIVLRAACLMTVAALGALLCRRLMRGVIFDPTNTRLTFGISLGLMLAAIVGPFFENMGLNGVFAALGVERDHGLGLLIKDGLPLYVAAIAVGALVVVFRRGTALERDAEGLV